MERTEIGWRKARDDGPIKEDAGMRGEEGEDRWSEGMERKTGMSGKSGEVRVWQYKKDG